MIANFFCRLISVFLLSLPLLVVVFFWDQLPLRLPVHFDSYRQPDQFTERQAWFFRLVVALFFMNVVRALLLHFAGKQPQLKGRPYQALYVLTAGFVAAMLSLLIMQSVCQEPICTDWLPVLFFLSGSGFIYVAVPPVVADLPGKIKEQVATNRAMAHRLAVVQHRYTLSRLVVVRVNLLAVGLMFFVDRSDRWSLGLLANGLAYAGLFILAVVTNRKPA